MCFCGFNINCAEKGQDELKNENKKLKVNQPQRKQNSVIKTWLISDHFNYLKKKNTRKTIILSFHRYFILKTLSLSSSVHWFSLTSVIKTEKIAHNLIFYVYFGKVNKMYIEASDPRYFICIPWINNLQ